MRKRRFFLLLLSAPLLPAQSFELRPVEPIRLPTLVDSNTPAFWRDGKLHIYSSTGDPVLTSGTNLQELRESAPVRIVPELPGPWWIEAIWQDDSGPLFAWYHHEVVGLCGDVPLSIPKIGAAVSHDGGRSFLDLGFVLQSGDPLDCGARNGFFAGGNGDFSVVFDQASQHFYFFFSNYGGDVSSQGVAMARMSFDDRYNPSGAVWKLHEGGWNQPGLGGKLTPIFPAVTGWASEDADSFWGPSVHWNTFLDQWVVLLNRACCAPGWPQAGVYISFNPDLSNHAGWRKPEYVIAAGDWYPQVLGTGDGETDRIAGETPRLFIRGFSDWEIVFRKPH
jgi:hypothetical protein